MAARARAMLQDRGWGWSGGQGSVKICLNYKNPTKAHREPAANIQAGRQFSASHTQTEKVTAGRTLRLPASVDGGQRSEENQNICD